MNRNPINILNDRISKATELATSAIRLAITVNRANKLQKIDLRKYRDRPEKKEQIMRMIAVSQMKVFALSSQGLIVSSQPIQTRTFESGCTILAKDQEIIINNEKH